MRALATLLLVCAAAGGQERVVDRIAVSVGNQVVTLSDIRRQIRMTALLNQEAPDLSVKHMREVAAMLVDQALVRREAELSRHPAPAFEQIEAQVEEFAADLGMNRQQLFAAAELAGFSENDLREHAAWRLTLVQFIDYRFRPGIQVSEGDISRYYEQVFVPEFRRRTPDLNPPPVDDVRDRIMAILNTELATEASQFWLEQTRKLARIRYFEESLK